MSRSAEDDDVLLQLARAVVGISTRAAERLGGVSVVQLRALTVLRSQGEANLGGLADGMGVAVSTASRLVDRLVQAGFAERRPSSRSRREVSLALTPLGRDLLDRYDELRLTSLRTGLDEQPEGARSGVARALAAYLTALGETPAGGTTMSEDGDRRLPGDEGGDPACLLRRVCPACGRVADEDPPTRCPGCAAELPGD